ncbi:MAG: DUF4124 domain-containing protein [Usitatibacter sp.]
MSRFALLAALAAFFVAVPAAAQTMYRWTDAQGRVQYSDRLPKDFKGEVTRIEADAQPTPPAAKPAPAKVEPAKAPEESDRNSRLRATREKLAAAVEQARARLEAAKKARDGDEGPGVDERQVVQQRFAKGKQPAIARSNCREVAGADGKKQLMCPALVPGEGYYARMKELDDAVAKAEEELDNAERAYRRGVD